MKFHPELHIALLHNGEFFGVYSPKGEVRINFNYGTNAAEVRTIEFGNPYRLMTKRVHRESRSFQRLGRLLWPLYEKATSDEWHDAQRS